MSDYTLVKIRLVQGSSVQVSEDDVETSHHVVAYVTRGSLNGMMTLRASGVTA